MLIGSSLGFFAVASCVTAIYHTQRSTPGWLLSCCLVAVTVTNSKARSALQTFAFGAICGTAMRNLAVLARPDSIDTRTWGPLRFSLCNAFNQRQKQVLLAELHRHWDILSGWCTCMGEKRVSCVDLNIKATWNSSVLLQKLNTSDFQ